MRWKNAAAAPIPGRMACTVVNVSLRASVMHGYALSWYVGLRVGYWYPLMVFALLLVRPVNVKSGEGIGTLLSILPPQLLPTLFLCSCNS
jgi:hypothetical protein